jgi:DNA-binding NtrC family response regulator
MDSLRLQRARGAISTQDGLRRTLTKEALQRVSASPAPDVILLDYRLPDSSDLKLLETIRRTVPESRVVMMTAFGAPAMQADALELGVYRILSKPVEMRDLVPLVLEAYSARAH